MRKLVAVLSLALVASAAASVWLWQELRAERERNAALSADLSELANSAPPAPAPATPAPVAPSAASPATAPPVESVAAVPPAAAQGPQLDWEAQQRRLFQDPRYRDAWRTQARLNYALRRANAIRIVGLTPEQADAAIEFYLDQQLRWQERGPNATVTPEQQQEEDRILEGQLRGLLGDDKYSRWQGYMESRGSRMQVDRLRTQLTGADALRDDQVEPLIAALHVEQAQARKSLEEYRESLRTTGYDGNFSQAFGEREIEETRAMHRRMHDAAGAVLSATQLRQFDDMLKLELARRETELRMNKLQRKVAVQASNDAD